MSVRKSRIYILGRRELGRMTKRPIYLLAMICAPLFCFIFFTTLMDEGLPSNIPAGVVDEDNTSLSRQILRNLDSFQQTEIVQQYSNFSEARSAMQEGKIYAFYYIPAGTTEKTLRSEQPSISFYTNASYLIAASLMYRDMTMMSEYAAAGVGRETMMARGYTMDQAMGFLQPIRIDMRAVGNPWLNYSIYLNNTLLPAALMLMIMLVTVFSVHTELKDGTSYEWLDEADGNIVVAAIGKLLPQTVIFSVMSCLYLIWLYGFLGFPLRSGLLPMLLAAVMLVMASQGFALFISSAIPSLRWALSLCTLWGVLSFPICGFSFPVMAMPPALQALSYFFPLRYYFLIYVDQALNGLSLSYSVWYYTALLGFMMLPLTDIRLLKRTALKYEYTY
ncbi:MAG: ABC transporter permease [Bacteroidaceae bacterium]|nr:ABC transporter permease [Bacteroidaceae bacterium]